jgi:hypothetical protein
MSANGTPMTSGAEQLNQEIAARQATEKQASDATAAQTAATATANETAFQAKAAAAKNQATQNINEYFKQQGVDPTGYASQIADAINTASGHVVDPYASDINATTNTAAGSSTAPVGTVDPGSVYAPTMGSDLFNQIQQGKQSQNLQQFNSKFTPSFSQTALSDNLIDPAVSSVISSQFDPLSQGLTNAQKRGTLNDTGYQAALKAMTDAQTGARSSVSKLAQGVLASDRGDIDSYLGTGRTAAGSAPLGTSFDIAPYTTGADTRVSRDISNFGGDVSNAVGATKYSDLTSLLNAGGSVQGANDPTAANPLGAAGPGGAAIGGGDLSPSFIAQQALAKTPRGLGTQGPF